MTGRTYMECHCCNKRVHCPDVNETARQETLKHCRKCGAETKRHDGEDVCAQGCSDTRKDGAECN